MNSLLRFSGDDFPVKIKFAHKLLVVVKERQKKVME